MKKLDVLCTYSEECDMKSCPHSKSHRVAMFGGVSCTLWEQCDHSTGQKKVRCVTVKEKE